MKSDRGREGVHFYSQYPPPSFTPSPLLLPSLSSLSWAGNSRKIVYSNETNEDKHHQCNHPTHLPQGPQKPRPQPDISQQVWAAGEGSECSEVEELWQVEAGLVVGLVADNDGSIPEDKGDEGKAESSVGPQEGEEGGEEGGEEREEGGEEGGEVREEGGEEGGEVREEGGERDGEEFGG